MKQSKDYIDAVHQLLVVPDEALHARLKNHANSLHALIGLATESGELLDNFKRHIFYGKDLDVPNILEECGDLLFYIAVIFHEFEYDFEGCMKANLAKLVKRNRGLTFNADGTLNRDLDGERKIIEKFAQ